MQNHRRIRFSALGALIALFILFSLVATAQGASVSGQVFLDGDGDGLMDEGGKFVEGAEVTLMSVLNGRESVSGVQKTGEDGRYSFPGVGAGEYRLVVLLPDGLFFTRLAEGGNAALPAMGNNGRTAPFTLQEAQQLELPIGASRRSAYLNVIAFGDENMNGGRFSSEPLLRGVALTLLFDWQGVAYEIAQAVTDREGFAQMRGLTPGAYRLKAVMPEPYIIGPLGQKINPFYNVIPPTENNEGVSEPFELEKSLGVGVGGVLSGTLTGRVWMDGDMDGRQSDGEGGLPGIELTLTHQALGVSRTLVTTAAPEYSFNFLQAGEYTLTATLPDGAMFVPDGSPSLFHDGFSGSQSAPVQVREGEDTRPEPIGVMPASGVQVVAFHDGNVNGVRDEGEPAFSGAKAEALNKGEAAAESLTDASGAALLPRVRSGEAEIRVTLPDGQIFSVAGGEDGNAFHAVSATSSLTVVRPLQPGERLVLQAGVTLPASISGTLFEDSDLSGVHAQGEGFLQGFSVKAVDALGQTAAQAQTDEQGAYLLENLVPSTYSVQFDLVSPYVFSNFYPAGTGMVNHVTEQTPAYGRTDAVTLSPGQHLDGMDAGAFRSAVIDGAVLLGDEEEGFSGAMGGLPGVQVELVGEDGMPVSEHTVAVTGEDGSFSLKGALPGTYQLKLTLPEGAKYSKPLTDETALLSGRLEVKASDRLSLEPLFAVQTGVVSGFAFYDLNNDGLPDGGDPRLPGATLRMTNLRTQEAYTSSSDNGGQYLLSGVRPGTYHLAVELPAGYALDANENSLLPASIGGKSETEVKIGMGTALTDTLMSAVKPILLSGISFYDNDLNGLYDEQVDAPYAASFRLTHLRTGKEDSFDADDDGLFSLDQAFPGQYRLDIQLPDDFFLSVPAGAKQAGVDWSKEFALNAGGSRLELAVVQRGSLGGTVWNMDGSGTGVSGIPIRLNSADGKTVAETQTGEDGSYLFDGLLPLPYTVHAQLPDTYRFARSADATERQSVITAELAGAKASEGHSGLLRLKMGQAMRNQDIGIGSMGKLGDVAWLDVNRNGMQDAGEPGVPGITVRLYRHGQVAGQAETDVYGRYLIAELYPGSYRVEVEMPPELQPTLIQTDFPLVASVLGPREGNIATADGIVVPSGGRNLNCDFGFVPVREGVLPESLLHLPQKDWTGGNEQTPSR